MTLKSIHEPHPPVTTPDSNLKRFDDFRASVLTEQRPRGTDGASGSSSAGAIKYHY